MNVSCFQTFKGLKRFVSMHAATFNLQRHLISRRTLRTFRAQTMADWNAATAAA
jgi:putative transposase